VIAIDRPGYGGSTACPGRRLLDWADDVAAVADALDIGRFCLVGVSGGGPYAAACAAALGSRIVATALMCPVPPGAAAADLPLKLGRRDLALLYFAGRHPQLARPVLALARRFLLDPELASAARLRSWLAKRLPERDLSALDEQTLTAVLDSFREGLRPGVWGQVDDARIYSAPWGFDLTGIETPVRVWHGTADRVVPPSSAEAYRALSRGEVHLLADEGHYSLVLNHGQRIVTQLRDDALANGAIACASHGSP